MIEKRYKKPVRKVYDPAGWDMWDTRHAIKPGQIVNVTASWGPFRAIEARTPTGETIRGTCGKGSLHSLSDKRWQ